MANHVWTLEDANLYCGSAPGDNTYSNHLILTEMKLPGLDMQFVDHRAGGAPIAIEVSTVIARLEVTFVCVGVTPQIMGLIGSWASTMNKFTAYGVIRNQETGEAAQAMAVIKGMLSRADPQNFRRGDVMHTNYSIRGIMHYELNIAGEPIYFWDFSTNTRIIGIVDQNQVINNFLGTGATTAPSGITTVSGWQGGA